MSEKKGNDNPKYRIELTAEQFHLVLEAVNMMMRTGMKQTFELTEWLATAGNQIATSQSDEKFNQYLQRRGFTKEVLDAVMKSDFPYEFQKSPDVLELETIYAAMRHQEWQDSNSHAVYDVRSYPPDQWGNEPIPKIEKIDDNK